MPIRAHPPMQYGHAYQSMIPNDIGHALFCTRSWYQQSKNMQCARLAPRGRSRQLAHATNTDRIGSGHMEKT
eukprot:5456261-Pyramimonas_sp.AAC.1